MDIVVDSHTHTIASGHAYSTILENALAAKNKGLKLLCTTDHAPEMPGAPHYWHFNNQRILPRFLHEVGILRGVEANTLNVKGEIDLPPSSDQHLDWVIASFHEPVFRPATEAEHTAALLIIGVLHNGIGHSSENRKRSDANQIVMVIVITTTIRWIPITRSHINERGMVSRRSYYDGWTMVVRWSVVV